MTTEEQLLSNIGQIDVQTFAAIMLRIPASSNSKINAMINEANQRDAYRVIANGVLSNSANPPQNPAGTMPVINQYTGSIK